MGSNSKFSEKLTSRPSRVHHMNFPHYIRVPYVKNPINPISSEKISVAQFMFSSRQNPQEQFLGISMFSGNFRSIVQNPTSSTFIGGILFFKNKSLKEKLRLKGKRSTFINSKRESKFGSENK